jgi:elongation factor Ts
MIDAKIVADLRARTGVGIVDCKKALEEAGGNADQAVEILRKKGAAKAAKKSAERQAAEGLVDAYVHANGKVGAIVEVRCETDFVARNPEFKEFVHDIAMQVVAMGPRYVKAEDIPAEAAEKERSIFQEEVAGENKPDDVKQKIVEGKMNKWYAEVCLMNQAWIKDDSKTIAQLTEERIASTGEKIEIARFSRIELSGEEEEAC